jgi:aminopeptidase YwaD
MLYKFLFSSTIFLLLTGNCFSQSSYAQATIKKLTSDEYNGRGYFKKGDKKASKFIMKEFINSGLMPYKNSYFQEFSMPVNTFPAETDVTVGNKRLVPGKDFIVSPSCPTVKGKYKIFKVDDPTTFTWSNAYNNVFLLLDKSGKGEGTNAAIDSLVRTVQEVKGIIIVEPKKLTWSVSGKVSKIPVIRILKDSFPGNSNTIEVNIKNKFIADYETRNVVGLIPGTINADSFIVFTAHYDHLGRMGKATIFPGANDNASGTAMIMDLARYYSLPANRPGKSLLFLAFAGEEAGLVGSEYYTHHPLIPLSRMSFLINLDLMGNGEEGIMVVNGEVYPEHYSILDSLNTEEKLLKTVGKRGKARNSDHYWFSENGVPSFFLYTTGGTTAYHDIYDVAENLPMTEFEDIKKLLEKFVNIIGK